jgi:hypothetical protein
MPELQDWWSELGIFVDNLAKKHTSRTTSIDSIHKRASACEKE